MAPVSAPQTRPCLSRLWATASLCLALALCGGRLGLAAPLSEATLARLAAGQSAWVVVEFDGSTVEDQARSERLRRGLRHDDEAISQQRRAAYRALKGPLERAIAGPDFTHLMDYSHLPLASWELRSMAALKRLQALPGVRAIHENAALKPASVSDLGLINQAAAVAAGGTGAGTTIAVIDGGLDLGYLSASDFGPCTDIATPAATCRVVLNRATYPGLSSITAHGTSVAAIALGTAPGAKLAMFDVFNGGSASVGDILSAINYVVANRSTYNFVAINLSLGDQGSNITSCPASSFYSAVTTARNAGIAVLAAAGNSGSKTGLSDPACVPGVISVGAVYDANYGVRSWNASAAPNGLCADGSAADMVACFSQSASYLSMLAPGTFVAAPDGSLVKTGTSQATPHVTGAVAILRARYPNESLGTTLQRLQSSGVSVTDAANGRVTPRLDVAAALQLGTALVLSGSGATTAVNGGNSNYTLTVTNNGPLIASNVKINFTLPTGASLQWASSGCTQSGSTVTCTSSTLAINASKSYTLQLHWTIDGPISASATVGADEINSAPALQQQVSFGSSNTASSDAGNGDAPLPSWAWGLLAAGLLWLTQRQMRAQESQQVRIRQP